MECGAAPVDEDMVATGAVADAPPGVWVQGWSVVEVVEDVVKAVEGSGALKPESNVIVCQAGHLRPNTRPQVRAVQLGCHACSLRDRFVGNSRGPERSKMVSIEPTMP